LQTVPLAVVGLVVIGAPESIVRLRVAVPVPPELVALMVTLYVPAVVGVPEINPVLVFTVKPAGKPVAL
jgi:hypothetical protein